MDAAWQVNTRFDQFRAALSRYSDILNRSRAWRWDIAFVAPRSLADGGGRPHCRSRLRDGAREMNGKGKRRVGVIGARQLVGP